MRLAAIILVALALAPLANAYDRHPFRIYGAAPDGWGNSTTHAEQLLLGRYPGIATVTCIGAIIDGYEGESSWVDGVVRYWDKLACAGYTRRGTVFALIFDSKARSAWVIYRLKNVTLDALRYG
jgi:hypothetical protein